MPLLKIFFSSILLFSTLFASPSQSEALLKLDTFGHTGIIKDIIVTKSGDIISASDDKTVRVWSSRTGKEKKKILGTIGKGSEGQIYAIALSVDEKYLAVGGYLNNNGNYEYGIIRIYNYHTGKLLQVLKSHTNVVADLSFSKDGRYLISGSFDRTAKLWEIQKNSDRFRLKDTISFHSNDVYAVKIIQKRKKYFALSAGYDNTIALYDMQKKKIIKSDKSKYKLQYLATNDTLKQIAVSGFGNEILIYDYELNFLKTIPSDTKPLGLNYSKDGRFLIAGTGVYPLNVNIYNTYKNYKLHTTFDKHTNLTMAVGFLEEHNTLHGVSAGGGNNEIYIWKIEDQKNSQNIKQKIVGVGQTVWSVGIDGDAIAWGNVFDAKGDYHQKQSSFRKSLNLKTFSIQNLRSNTQKFNRISTSNRNYTLSHSKGGDYGYSAAVLEIKKEGRVVSKIVKKSNDGYRHNCYGWYNTPNASYIISGGANGHLKVYDREGKERASLIGHTGDIWSIALDGDRLVSGSSDQTMMVWDLSSIGSSTSSGSKIEPMLSIFVSKDDEYIIWSKSGYFSSSTGGDKYVGYHINQGSSKEAQYVGSDKYFDTLYRPDIIEAIWETRSEKKAIAFASRSKKVQKIDISTSLPPVLSLLSDAQVQTEAKTIDIRYSVESSEKILETLITLNGKKLNTRALKIKKKNQNIKVVTIELEDGENIISIRAKNKFATSDDIQVNAFKKSLQKSLFKPTLYLLSIGVSSYENKEYDLGVAHKDALSISKMMHKQKNKIYKDVKVKTLTNTQATSDNILDALDWIDKEVTSKDVAMIFIAGHGVNDEKGNYYFLSHDGNLERLRRTAVKWTEIEDTISNLPSKVILLADTCHSGNIAGTRRDITSAVKSITNSSSGSIIMTATTGSGYSYEQTNWGHGAFTKSLLEGLDKYKADHDNDGVITIKEIDFYVTNRVKKLTNGKQKPTTIIPNSVPDFAIGVK